MVFILLKYEKLLTILFLTFPIYFHYLSELKLLWLLDSLLYKHLSPCQKQKLHKYILCATGALETPGPFQQPPPSSKVYRSTPIPLTHGHSAIFFVISLDLFPAGFDLNIFFFWILYKWPAHHSLTFFHFQWYPRFTIQLTEVIVFLFFTKFHPNQSLRLSSSLMLTLIVLPRFISMPTLPHHRRCCSAK